MKLYAVGFKAWGNCASQIFANSRDEAESLFRENNNPEVWGYAADEPIVFHELKDQDYLMRFAQSDKPHEADYMPVCRKCGKWGDVHVDGLCPDCLQAIQEEKE